MTSNNIKSGVELWNYTSPQGYFVTGPAISGNDMFFATTNNVYKLRMNNRHILWQKTYMLGAKYKSDVRPLTFCRNSVIVVATYKLAKSVVCNIMAIDTSSGSLLWKKIFRLDGTSEQATATAEYKGNLYLGLGKYIECIDGNNGNILWKKILSSRASFIMPPSVVEGNVYTGTATNVQDSLYALSATDGSLVWSTSLGDGFAGTYKTDLCTPVVYNQQLIVNGHLKVAAFNALNGNKNWEFADNNILSKDIIKPVSLSTEPGGSYYVHFTNVSGRVVYTLHSNGDITGATFTGYYDGYICNACPVAIRIYNNNDANDAYFIHSSENVGYTCETSGGRTGTLWSHYTSYLVINIVVQDESGNVYYSSDSGMQQ
jgi:hypothetical protein